MLKKSDYKEKNNWMRRNISILKSLQKNSACNDTKIEEAIQ